MADRSEVKWLPVVGYEGFYEVSDRGQVRRVAGGRGTRKGVLRQATHPNGYKAVCLSMNNVQSRRTVHSLVAQAFLGARPEGLEVCHNNQIHGDNRPGNLRYDTHKANCQERVPGVRKKPLPATCRRGHEFNAENTRFRPSAGTARICLKCERRRDAERQMRRIARG